MDVRTLSEPDVAVVSLDDIGVDPNHNPRTDFNPEELKALEASLEATDGLVQSLAVQKAAEDEPFVYTLVDGERRYRALRAIGVEKAPVLILKTRNATLAATAANQSRVPLNSIEEAHGITALAELEGLKTNKQIANRIGALRKPVSEEYVAKHRRLLKLPESVQSHIAAGRVSVEAERNLRKAAQVSPALASCACQLVESGAVDSRDLVEQFGWVIDKVAETDLADKPVMINMDRAQPLGALVTDHDAYASLVERCEKITGEKGTEPGIRFTEDEIDAARASGCLIEISKGTDAWGEKRMARYLTDADLAADLATRVIERSEREAEEAAAEAACEEAESTDEIPEDAEAKAKEEAREERKEACKASEAAHTANTAIGRALISSRGAKNRKENKAAWVEAVAAVLLRTTKISRRQDSALPLSSCRLSSTKPSGRRAKAKRRSPTPTLSGAGPTFGSASWRPAPQTRSWSFWPRLWLRTSALTRAPCLVRVR